MLGPGDPVPDARVWAAPMEGPLELRDAIGGGSDFALLCFYLWDWSPT